MTKTGSTVLQDCLLLSRDYLLSRGVLYPSNAGDVPYNNHRLLAYPALGFERLPRHMLQNEAGPADLAAQYDSFVATVSEQIAAAEPDCLVLSAETLFRASPGRLREALDRLGAGNVEIAVYLRRPSEHYLSVLQQKLRASWQVLQPRPLAFRRTLEQYRDTFGADAMRPRVFARPLLADGDIVSDFCAAYLADRVDRSGLRTGHRKNETTSAEAMDILRCYRWDFDRDRNDQFNRETRQLLDELRTADAALGAQRPRLRPGLADLVDQATDEPLWLRDTYGLEFPGYDYARAERDGARPLPERTWQLHNLVEIDPGLRAAMLAHLAGTRWGAEPARAGWLDGLQRGAA
jgi:hypothetical protein